MRLQQQLNDLTNDKSDAVTLKSENEKLQTIKLALETEITKLNQMITELKNQSQNASHSNTQMETLITENETLKQTIEELNNQIELHQTDHNTLRTEFDEYKQKSMVSHRTSIINEQIIIATLKQQITTLESKLETPEQIDAYKQYILYIQYHPISSKMILELWSEFLI